MRPPRSAASQPAQEVGKDLHQRLLCSCFQACSVAADYCNSCAGCNSKAALSGRAWRASSSDRFSPVTRGFVRRFRPHACQPCSWGDRVRFHAWMRPNELHRCAGEVFGQHNQLQLASFSCTARIAAQPSSRKYKNVFATTAAPLVLWGDAHTDYCQAPAHLQPPQPHQTLIICASRRRRRAASRRNAIMP